MFSNSVCIFVSLSKILQQLSVYLCRSEIPRLPYTAAFNVVVICLIPTMEQ